MRPSPSLRLLASVVATAVLFPAAALACGCLAPPDPVNTVVQAGERILFHARNGQITAHIQIQYSGAAADFGWLLPLPSVPTLELGSDELFAMLEAQTTPSYRVQVTYPQSCDWGVPPQLVFGEADFGAASPDPGGPSPLVVRDSVGPYDYAVLKADSKTAMLDWLATNRFFVPAGTDSVVAPYIHPGAYFLALKLRSGQSTGDIAPVVVRYASDLPMVPLILTSVTTSAVLDVTTWILGAARAIPRNYHHVVLDDAALDWDNLEVRDGGAVPRNYAAQVRAAVAEVKGGHAFVTELAQPLNAFGPVVSEELLGLPGLLPKLTDAASYLNALRGAGIRFGAPLVAILKKYIQQPPDLQGFQGTRPSPANYYYNFDYWHGLFPQYFEGIDLRFDPVALTAEIDKVVLKPLRDAKVLFDNSDWLTRLYTRIAAADMNSDPVFSFNPKLPTVAGGHTAVREMHCNTQPWTYYGRLTTEQGYVVDDRVRGKVPALPAARRVEILREDGPPEVVVDNAERIRTLLPASPPDVIVGGPDAGGDVVRRAGCSVSPGTTADPRARRSLPLALATLALVATLWSSRRRRQRPPA